MEGVGERVQVSFEPAQGTPLSMSVQVSGEPVRVLQRIERNLSSAERLEAFAGRYYSPELEHRQVIALTPGGLVALRRAGPMTLTHVLDDLFTTDAGVSLTFQRDVQGNITGFGANAGRVRDLHYTRE